MNLLNSDDLLNILEQRRVLTSDQRQLVLLGKGKQRQKLLRQFTNEGGVDRNYPDMVDIIVSLGLTVREEGKMPVDEELIMRAVAADRKLPFKKLDPSISISRSSPRRSRAISPSGS